MEEVSPQATELVTASRRPSPGEANVLSNVILMTIKTQFQTQREMNRRPLSVR